MSSSRSFTLRTTSTVLLPERYESEGRSHAFNAVANEEGAGLLGLPTVMRRAQSGRWWWRRRKDRRRRSATGRTV